MLRRQRISSQTESVCEKSGLAENAGNAGSGDFSWAWQTDGREFGRQRAARWFDNGRDPARPQARQAETRPTGGRYPPFVTRPLRRQFAPIGSAASPASGCGASRSSTASRSCPGSTRAGTRRPARFECAPACGEPGSLTISNCSSRPPNVILDGNASRHRDNPCPCLGPIRLPARTFQGGERQRGKSDYTRTARGMQPLSAWRSNASVMRGT